jgi:hypothetical protein
MSKKRDEAWKNLQSWRRLLKRPDVLAVLRRGEGNFDLEIKSACDAYGLDSAKPIDRTLLLGVFAASHFPRSGALTAGPFKARKHRSLRKSDRKVLADALTIREKKGWSYSKSLAEAIRLAENDRVLSVENQPGTNKKRLLRIHRRILGQNKGHPA